MARNVKQDRPRRRCVRRNRLPTGRSCRQGDRVLVRLTPGFETGGLVDAITSDHTAIWVDLDGGRGRTLLHCSDGVEIILHEG